LEYSPENAFLSRNHDDWQTLLTLNHLKESECFGIRNTLSDYLNSSLFQFERSGKVQKKEKRELTTLSHDLKIEQKEFKYLRFF